MTNGETAWEKGRFDARIGPSQLLFGRMYEDASIELDGVRHPVQPHSAVLIPPGVRHRACGEMTVLIVCTPDFDSSDEHFD